MIVVASRHDRWIGFARPTYTAARITSAFRQKKREARQDSRVERRRATPTRRCPPADCDCEAKRSEAERTSGVRLTHSAPAPAPAPAPIVSRRRPAATGGDRQPAEPQPEPEPATSEPSVHGAPAGCRLPAAGVRECSLPLRCVHVPCHVLWYRKRSRANYLFALATLRFSRYFSVLCAKSTSPSFRRSLLQDFLPRELLKLGGGNSLHIYYILCTEIIGLARCIGIRLLSQDALLTLTI